MRILAVDDDPIILELLAQFVDAVGDHDLTTAPSAMAALELIESGQDGPFDCFLFDIQMPGMDGIELTRRLRDTARHADTPVLMLTAMAEKRYIDNAFAAGATDYVTKPFEVTELKARLHTAETLIAARKARTRKIFATQTVSEGVNHIEVYEPISVYDVENVIDYTAMENYVAQLSRQSLFGSTAFAFTIRQTADYHAGLSAFEFFSMISDVAEVISDTLTGHQFLMSYAGSGTFMCITESGWRPDMKALMDAINLSLARTELYNNDGQRLQPRVCAGNAVRLVWKNGDTVMEAIAAAHASAEEACDLFAKTQNNYWDLGQTA
ncbi:response regulator [Sulfitobacter sp. JB4-11]|uniref:response regulator n=1 Tax=Sulfitobacter rhodophyticola TaxID=3238304 RepID=UPI00351819AD